MKELLIAEMKRALELLEKKDEIKVMKRETIVGFEGKTFEIPMVDRETSELKQILRLIRKHSVMLEKGIK